MILKGIDNMNNGMFNNPKTMGIVEGVISGDLDKDVLNTLDYHDRCKLHQYFPELFHSPTSKENAYYHSLTHASTEDLGIPYELLK